MTKMMHSQCSQAVPVIFLHGLLGSQTDWQAVIANLQTYHQIRPLTLDLPYHGNNQQNCHDFAEVRQWLANTIQQMIGEQPFWLVGYSLGGRIALDYSLTNRPRQLLGTMLEGTNIGLATERERTQRWQNDSHWANRFNQEPIDQVLQDWYQQPVFTHLTATQRQQLIAQRQHNDGKAIATMLLTTSLAKQPFFEPAINANKRSTLPLNLHFLIGEKDQKFRQQAEKYQFTYQLISNAGHNAHRENPVVFSQKLIEITKTLAKTP